MTTDGRGEYGGGGGYKKGTPAASGSGRLWRPCRGESDDVDDWLCRAARSVPRPAGARALLSPTTHPPPSRPGVKGGASYRAPSPPRPPPNSAPCGGAACGLPPCIRKGRGGGGGGEAPLPGGGSPARLATAAGCLPQTQPAGAIPIGRVRGGEGMSRRGGCALAAVVSGSYGASAAVTRQAS